MAKAKAAQYYGTGRRKKSIARVYLVPGKGDVTINIDASTSTDSENFPNTALATNGYVDEKMAWIEVEEN